MNNTEKYIEELCRKTKSAAPSIAAQGEKNRNELLLDIAKELISRSQEVIQANHLDVCAAQSGGMSESMIDRLKLGEKRIAEIAEAIRQIAALPDPIGRGEVFTNRDGLEIRKVRVPLGVIAMIFEARPNVTYDAAALCIKSGNAVILRGGKEAINSNRCAVNIIRDVLRRKGIDENAVSLVDDTTREGSACLMRMRGYVDVLIPRGSKSLIQSVINNSLIPCIETGAGNCHLYVDESAELDMALRVAINAKASRPSVCNAIETLLVNEKTAPSFLPMFEKEARKYNIELRCDELSARYLEQYTPACEEDYETEYNDYIIAIKTVHDVNEAITHINRYGTGHSEAIITSNMERAAEFQKRVDAAAVYVNASTRFTDGGVFGLGAEIGISTQKLHARGPMGLCEMTTVKYLINGNGQIR